MQTARDAFALTRTAKIQLNTCGDHQAVLFKSQMNSISVRMCLLFCYEKQICRTFVALIIITFYLLVFLWFFLDAERNKYLRSPFPTQPTSACPLYASNSQVRSFFFNFPKWLPPTKSEIVTFIIYGPSSAHRSAMNIYK